MPVIENPTFEDIDGILAYLDNPNLRWNAQTDIGTNVIITYSFPQGGDLPDGPGGSGVTGFEGFTEAQEAGFRTVLDQVEQFSGVRFVEVEGDAMIDGMIGVDGTGASGYAYYPYMSGGVSQDSDIVMIYTDFEEAGTFTYMVAMHELGHALGLQHTHQGGHTVDDDDDILENSVMTYNITYPIPDTYGTFDEAALEHLYGDNSTSILWDITVLDSGAIQTIGSKFDDSFMGVSFENVIKAGKGDDDVLGREADDKLLGQAGDDILDGAQGRDILRGGMGNDELSGGTGNDVLIGGGGNDVFVFESEYGYTRDRIFDFDQGEDLIDLSAMNVDFLDLTILSTQSGKNVTIYLGGDEIVLKDVAGLTLEATDFIFAEDTVA